MLLLLLLLLPLFTRHFSPVLFLLNRRQPPSVQVSRFTLQYLPYYV
jgi:hypothetical protein